LSAAARPAVEADPSLDGAVLGGGDDYELLFTAAAGRGDAVAAVATSLDLPLTAVGRVTEEDGVRVIDADGAEIAVPRPGYRHF
jgi:thiamine-monophosphate kinase